MGGEALFREKVSSNKTTALFVGLTLAFAGLFVWRWATAGAGAIAIALLAGCAIFLFYSLNYRTLDITLTQASLELRFGIFTWRVPLDNVDDVRLDALPALMRLGGAGIHFMMIRGRYRASFNFLEHPRVVVALKRKAGLVRDVSFSTREPERMLRLILARAPAHS